MSNQPSLDNQEPLNKSDTVEDSPQGKTPQGWQSCLLRGGVITVLVTAAGGVAAGIWIGILLIFDPNSVLWLNRYLPSNQRISPATPSQTLGEIQTTVIQEGFIPGNSLALEGAILLPLSSPEPEGMVALRVYQPLGLGEEDQEQYQLTSQITIPEIPERTVLTVLEQSNDSLKTLPLKELSQFENAPKFGIWLNTSGQLVQGEQAIAYGHLFYYHPQSWQLQHLLQWTSPVGEIPQWKNVTGDETPELVINQTLGEDPTLKIYQFSRSNLQETKVDLKEISNP